MKKAFVQLVLGGVRSGKTKFAEECADQKGGEWISVDFPTDLKQFFSGETGVKIFIVNNLTQFVQNALKQGKSQKYILKQAEEVLDELTNHECAFIFISSEAALAFQDDESLKTFMETLGELNQRVAAVSDEIYYMLAGIPTVVKKEMEVPASRLSELTQSASYFMGAGMEGGFQSMGLLDMGVEDVLPQVEKEDAENE